MKRCLGCMKEYDDEYEVCPHCGFVEGTEADEAYYIQPGTILQDRYIVGRVLGYGGFGITYIGWDEDMERKVAIKEYLPSEFSTRMPDSTQVTVFSGDREEQFMSGMDKFVDEAKRLAKFHSSNGIIHIFDSFKENNTAYIVMEYLEGESLKDRLAREGKMEVDEALSIILPILYALREVHKLDIIHRDIAPDNIYLTNEHDENGNPIVKLLDFGAARFSTTKHSKSLSVLVKPGYSPEEQYRSDGDQGPWTDVYAVSATLYRMITGVVPQISLNRSAKDEVKTPSKLGIKIHKGLENAIMNGMNIKIENRTQSVDQLIAELESEQTKRHKEKIRKMDVGRWPLWLKITSGAMAAAVAVLVVVVGLWMADVIKPGDSTIPDGQTRVPNVINLSVGKAEQQAKDSKLVFQILDKEYSTDVGVGKVLKQNHLGGSLVSLENDDGSKGTLAVTISAGQEMTYVPDVENFMLDAAQQQMTNANLVTTTTEAEGDDAPGSVASQSLEANTEVNVGTNVDLVISTGRNFDASITTTAPSVIGMDYADAKALCIGQCLYLAKSELRADADVPKGQIIEQSVAEGESIAQNSTIMVVVSAGQEMVYVPDVQYKTQEDAIKLLESQKLKVTVKEKNDDTVQKGHVISQSVESGSSVKAGTEVIIYISKGNNKADNSITVNDIVVTKSINAEAEKQQAKQDNSQNNKSDEKQKDNRVSVANVVGKSYTEAAKTIKGQVLIVYSSEAFSSSVADGNVISQGIAAGTKVNPGESVLLVVSKGPEAPSGWTTDASFVNNPHYNVQTKVQYQTQTRSKQTTQSNDADMSNWTRDDSKTTSEWQKVGSEVDNGEKYVASYENQNNKRTVSTYSIGKTRQVAYTETVGTEFNYSHYKYWYNGAWWYTYASNPGRGTNVTYEERGWGDELYLNTNYGNGHYGTMVNGVIWFNESSRPKTETRYRDENYTVTGYKYQDYKKVYTYTFWRYTNWSDWSAWQDNVVSASDTVNVQTRTVYYYTAK